jgi:Ser/Thr protein kinase RdoA (MazF antagonist)
MTAEMTAATTAGMTAGMKTGMKARMKVRSPLERSQARDRNWLDVDDTIVLPAVVRAAFRELDGPLRLRSLHGGLLHQSFHVRAGPVEYVLQRVSEVFAPEIHQNIEAVTGHLVARGLPAPRLIPTRKGELSAALGPLGRWRLMEHLGGVSFEKMGSALQARSAGALVGRFHAALRDFDAPLCPMGIPYRDTPHYLAALREALARHRSHRLHAPMARLAERIFAAFETLGTPAAVRERVIHGDLKLSNLLFEGEEGAARDRAFALVDFDTLMRGTLWMELGDAWRSWCNAAGEDSSSPRFDLEIFAASCEGFASGYGLPLERDECDSLTTAPERITLELCARFVTDALEETYFGWDSERFPARGEHNAVRAEGQWRLAEVTAATRARRRELLRRLG